MTKNTPPSSTYSVEHRGCRFAYDICGDGRPILFIQGTGLHGAGWLPQVEGLASDHLCLWFDNRGMGRSQPIGATVSVAQMAEDALAVMDAAGWESAHIVGHSLGGPIAVELALNARERVRSLGLLCTFANGRNALPLTPYALWVATRTSIGTRRQRRHAFVELVMSPEALAGADGMARDKLAADLAPLFGHDLATQPPVVSQQLKAMRAYDATPRLHELAGIPTLVVSATHDLIAPPKLGRALAAGIPGARYIEIPAAAHGVVIERADEINDLLREHVAAAEVTR